MHLKAHYANFIRKGKLTYLREYHCHLKGKFVHRVFPRLCSYSFTNIVEYPQSLAEKSFNDIYGLYYIREAS